MSDHDEPDTEPAHDEEPEWLARERVEAFLHAQDSEWELDASLPPPAAYQAPTLPKGAAPVDDGIEHTSWWPVNLGPLFDGTHQPPTPELFTRDDGQPLLYQGKCHAFNGESESGKTWAALIACVQTIRDGGHVLFLDFEDSADTVVTRLLALGAKPAQVLELFHYVQPAEPVFLANMRFTPANVDLQTALEQWPITLAVIDGVTEAMTMHGLDLIANADYAQFHRALPRRVSLTGAAVIQIDHVTKNSETRGRFAIGAQHKLAAMDGAVFGFHVKLPFGLGRRGWCEITVEKDRPGQLRQHARGKRIADLLLDSDRDTHALTWTIETPEAAAEDTTREDPIPATMELISRYLEANPQGVAKRSLREAVPAGAAQIDDALDLLKLAWVKVEKVGNRHVHLSTRPYRAGDTTAEANEAA